MASWDIDNLRQNRLTESSLLDLLGRQSKDGQYLNHHPDDNSCHRGSGGDRGINLESRNEASDAIKDVYKEVITFPF